MLFAGLFRLWFTSAWIAMIESSQEHLAVIGGLVTCVIGALLAYVGFFLKSDGAQLRAHIKTSPLRRGYF